MNSVWTIPNSFRYPCEGPVRRIVAALAVATLALLVIACRAEAGTTSLISTGPLQANAQIGSDFGGVSTDGAKAYFVTTASLTAADADGGFADVYLRTAGSTSLISAGPLNTNAAKGAFFGGSTPDGATVYFTTAASLTADDVDGGYMDVYSRSGGTTTLVSTGPLNANIAAGAEFGDVSADGSVVAFTTTASLTAADTDGGFQDVYRRSGGITTLVSTGTLEPNVGTGAEFSGITGNGSSIVFTTGSSHVASDTDGGFSDVYVSDGASTSLVSTGPLNANVAMGAEFGAVAVDGSKTFFTSTASLTVDDTDGGFVDVFMRSGGVTTLVSTGAINSNSPSGVEFGGISNDGSHVYFTTAASLASNDTDVGFTDVYERAGGSTVLISTGVLNANKAAGAVFGGNSADGSRVFFNTSAQLTIDDVDLGSTDAFERSGGKTVLISKGNGILSIHGYAQFAGNSGDGVNAFFTSGSALVPADDDSGFQDVYQRTTDASDFILKLLDTDPPEVSRLMLLRRAFSVDRRFKSVQVAASKPRGTRIFFSLSEAASISLSIGRVARTTAGKRCGLKLGNGKFCVLKRKTGGLNFAASEGFNSVRYGGQRSANKHLRPGRYMVTLTATDADGNKSAAKQFRITILR